MFSGDTGETAVEIIHSTTKTGWLNSRIEKLENYS